MGFRFRKSIKIAPGLKLNLGTRGASLSVGGRGGRLTFGSSGVRATVGIPGTGISYTEKIGGSSRNRSNRSSYNSVPLLPQKISSSLQVSNDGNIEFFDDNGNLLYLSPKIKKLAFEQNRASIRSFLEAEAERWNQGINEILNIHLKTPPSTKNIFFTAKPFLIPKPTKPLPKQASFLDKLIPSKQEAIQYENEMAQQNYERELKEWERLRQEYKQADDKRKWLIETGRYSNAEKMQEFMEYIFSDVEFPRETILSFQVESDGKGLMIDVDLPEIEDLPTEHASIAANGIKLNIKQWSETQLRKNYMSHIHGIGFYVIGQAFVALPTIEKIVCSGYSQRLDKTTGQINDEYLFSVRVIRKEWEKINFGNLNGIDLITCLGSFDIKRKMTKSGVFTSIIPFKSVNDEQSANTENINAIHNLVRGQKIKLPDITQETVLQVALSANMPTGIILDISCFGIDAHEKLSDDRYFIFYNQKSSPCGAIKSIGSNNIDTEQFEVALSKIPSSIRKLVFVITIDGNGVMSQLNNGYLRLIAQSNEVARFSFTGADFHNEKAIMVAEIYFKNVWRFAAVGQGFSGGLSALLKHFEGESNQ